MPIFLKHSFSLLICCLLFLGASKPEETHSSCDDTVWGFYGHKKINRKAIFTLPSGMIKFYKRHIEFISEHAVDPDKRRYAIKQEAYRHYIDIDHWGEAPFPDLPREQHAAFWKFAEIQYVLDSDTIKIDQGCNSERCYNNLILKNFWQEMIQIEAGEKFYKFDYDEAGLLANILGIPVFDKLIIEDVFTFQGILPYHLNNFYPRLVRAFQSSDPEKILKYSAEMGHYISDANVPLHTTVNYNGQLTDQVGIHGFWESRIPELFADEQYDFFVGRAEYVENKKEYFWDIVLESHSLVDSVLQIERDLKLNFPQDLQMCFDERLEQTIWVQCPEFAQAYQLAMDGMVEARMADSVKALGDIWYSAWVDAGEPDINNFELLELSKDFKKESEKLDEKYKEGEVYGREHKG